MDDYILRVRRVPLNSPRHRVWKGEDNLWHVSRSGLWIGAFGRWDAAITAAADGRIVVGAP